MSLRWKDFEKTVESTAKVFGYTVIKIPERFIRVYKGRPIQKKTSFDFAAGVDGSSVFFDCKCRKGSKFEFSKYLFDKEKKHQWEALQEAHDQGNRAGYLVWWYEPGLYAWLDVEVIRYHLELGMKYCDPMTTGVIIEDDSRPLNLRSLLREDKVGHEAKEIEV